MRISSDDRVGIPGAHCLVLPSYADPRGSFSPAWIRSALLAHGLDGEIAQVNLATNPAAGTLRGLHFQKAPFAEVKIVQVISGAIFDVVVDLRRDSPTFRTAFGLRLDAATRKALYLPKGTAHGYQTLVPDTTVLYTVSSAYAPDHQGGILWNDPGLAIPWPMTPTLMSERDLALPLLQDILEVTVDG
ncbi:MAG TPA: dTDP-4-dehydrorhamnose 3,5-epimerase family protein [Hyphomonadaceae bacterium]|nr:dTDP-4-dehydrorhamnose 3,5-epimerase family protein [Hyphomonadaceae bacterium]